MENTPPQGLIALLILFAAALVAVVYAFLRIDGDIGRGRSAGHRHIRHH